MSGRIGVIMAINFAPLDLIECMKLKRLTNEDGEDNFDDDEKSNRKTFLVNKSPYQKVFDQRRESRKLLTVVLFSWLLLNADPIYLQKVLGSMVASRLLNRSLQKYASKMVSDSRPGGLSAVEAIALIHAMNSGNRGSSESQNADLLALLGAANPHQKQSNQNIQTKQAQSSLTRQDVALSRQLAPVTGVAAVVAAVAAFLAAAFAGLTPVAAAAAALAAFAVALVAALLALIVIVTAPNKNKSSPIVKKLIIKKTVLPFVIPIPFKKKEKEIIYKYIPKSHHYEHHHYEKKHKYKYKHKKMDTLEEEDKPIKEQQSIDQLDKIQTLMSEQDQIQDLINEVETGKTSTSTVPMIAERS